MGESFVHPNENADPQPAENGNASGPAQIDAALGITGTLETMATVPTSSTDAPNATLNAVHCRRTTFDE